VALGAGAVGGDIGGNRDVCRIGAVDVLGAAAMAALTRRADARFDSPQGEVGVALELLGEDVVTDVARVQRNR